MGVGECGWVWVGVGVGVGVCACVYVDVHCTLYAGGDS